MKCGNHPENDSVSTCTLCGGYYCDICSVQIDGKDYCQGCIKKKISSVDHDVDKSVLRADKERIVRDIKKSKFLGLIFSLVPGVGYLYLGLMKKGFQTMVAFFGSIFIANFIGFQEATLLVVPVLMFYSIFDTQQLIRDLNEGLPIEDKELYDITQFEFNQKWIGYGLIIVGIFAFINSLPFGVPYWFHGLLPPVLMIGAGAAILYRHLKNEKY